jgi:hypothetical protein
MCEVEYLDLEGQDQEEVRKKYISRAFKILIIYNKLLRCSDDGKCM